MFIKMINNHSIEIFKKRFAQDKAIFSNEPEPLCYLTDKKIPREFKCHPIPINKRQNTHAKKNYKLKCYYEDDVLTREHSIRDFAQNIKNNTHITVDFIINNTFLSIKNKHYRTVLLDATSDFINNYYVKLNETDKNKVCYTTLDDSNVPYNTEYYEDMILPVIGSLVFIKDNGDFFAAVPITSYYIMENKYSNQEIEIIKTTVDRIKRLIDQDTENKSVTLRNSKNSFKDKYIRDRFILKRTDFGNYNKEFREHNKYDIGIIELNYNHVISHSDDTNYRFIRNNLMTLNHSQAKVVQKYLLTHFNTSIKSATIEKFIVHKQQSIQCKPLIKSTPLDEFITSFFDENDQLFYLHKNTLFTFNHDLKESKIHLGRRQN